MSLRRKRRARASKVEAAVSQEVKVAVEDNLETAVDEKKWVWTRWGWLAVAGVVVAGLIATSIFFPAVWVAVIGVIWSAVEFARPVVTKAVKLLVSATSSLVQESKPTFAKVAPEGLNVILRRVPEVMRDTVPLVAREVGALLLSEVVWRCLPPDWSGIVKVIVVIGAVYLFLLQGMDKVFTLVFKCMDHQVMDASNTEV
eukprot:scaffold2687_cov305-Pinguiococcus_pyrenoidosus.AAC.3